MRDSAVLANVRLQKARACLQSAERELAAGEFPTAVNRSYYCIFHSMRAVLAYDEFDSKKHSGIISAFHKNYIKTRVFSAQFSDIIDNAFEIRNDSDYDDFFLISKADIVAQIENARTFLEAVEKYISQKTQ